MTKPDLFTARWNWPGIAVCNLLAAALITSWLWQPSRQLWDLIDLQIFHFLNAPIASSPIWAHIWAIGNMRPVDVVVGLIMLGILIRGDWIFERVQVRRALLGFLAILALLLLIRIGFVEMLKLIGWQRPGPSLTVEGAVRLTETFPGWEDRWYLKDSSSRSFPGDHASVLMIWAMLLSVYARGRKLLLIWTLATIFMLPRLASGAHWVSDDLVGGLFVSLLAFGWGFCSPYAARVSGLLERYCLPAVRMLRRLPGIGRMSLFAVPQTGQN